VGAGGLAASTDRPASLAFSSTGGPNALERLCDELGAAGLQPQDMLRLRLFSHDDAWASQTRERIEELLSPAQRPAISVVQLSHGSAGEGMFDGSPGKGTLDAIAAAGGRHKQATVHGTVRFGDWVFVGALRGTSPFELPLEERIELESRQVFADMEHRLRTAGTELRDVVRVGGWLGFPMSGYEPLARVRSELLERRGLLPASAAAQVSHAGAAQVHRTGAVRAPYTGGQVRHANAGHAHHPGAEPLLAFEAIAFAGPSERHPTPSSLAPYYAAARSAGGYVFSCGEIPRCAASVSQQVSDVYEQLAAHLHEQGASTRQVVHQTVFVRAGADLAAVQLASRAFFGSTPVPTTVLPAVDLGFRPGVDVEIELVGMLDDE
jgi:enamine deaminase RidA (YjgF/YER057c/UK114 family)